MPLKTPARPSADAIRVLRHIALYGSFGTAAGATAYVLEDQRRQICKLKRIVENGRKLNEFKRYHHTDGSSSSCQKPLDFNAFIQSLESSGRIVKEPVSQEDATRKDEKEFHYHIRIKKCTKSAAGQDRQHGVRNGHLNEKIPGKWQSPVEDQAPVNLPDQTSPPIFPSRSGSSLTPNSQLLRPFLENSSVTDRHHPLRQLDRDSLEKDISGKLAAPPSEHRQNSSTLSSEIDNRNSPQNVLRTVRIKRHEFFRKISLESRVYQIAGLKAIVHASSRMLSGAVLLQMDAALWERRGAHVGDIREDPLVPKHSPQPELPVDVVGDIFSAWQRSHLLQDLMKEVSDYLTRVIAFQYNVLRILDKLKARLSLHIVRRRTIHSLHGAVDIYSDVARFIFDLELRLMTVRLKHHRTLISQDIRPDGASSHLSREDHSPASEHIQGVAVQLEEERKKTPTFPKPWFWLKDTLSKGDSLNFSGETNSLSLQSALGSDSLLEESVEPASATTIPHSSHEQASLIRLTWLRTRDLKQVETLFDTLLSAASIADRSLDTQVHNARVWAFIQARAYEQASAYLKSAFILGNIRADADTLDLMMTVAAVRNDWTLVEDLQKAWNDFQGPNKPSKHQLFRAIFSQYCSEATSPRIAQFVWTITQRLGIQYVNQDLEAILSECFKAGDIEKAIALAYYVREHGSHVQVTAYTVLKAFRSYTRHHRPTGYTLLQLLEQLKTVNRNLLSKELVALVWGILANQLRQHAQAGRGHSHLRYHHHHERNFQSAIPYLRTLFADSRSLREGTPQNRKKIPPSLVKAEMNSALSTGNFEEVVRIHDRHKRTGIRGRPDMLNLSVCACEKMGQREKAEALIEQAHVAGENTRGARMIMLLSLIKSKDIMDPHVLERLVFDFYQREEQQTGKIEHGLMTGAAANLLNRTVKWDGVSNYVSALNLVMKAYLTYAEKEPFHIAQWTVFFQAYSQTGNWKGVTWVIENILARHVKIDLHFFKMLWAERTRWLKSTEQPEQAEVVQRAFNRIRNRLRREYQGNRWWSAEIGKKMVQVLTMLQEEFAGVEMARPTLQETVRPLEDYVLEENQPERKLPRASIWTRYSPIIRDSPWARLPPPSTTLTNFLIPTRNRHRNRNQELQPNEIPQSASIIEENKEPPDGNPPQDELFDISPMVAHE